MFGKSICPVVDVIGKFSCGHANSAVVMQILFEFVLRFQVKKIIIIIITVLLFWYVPFETPKAFLVSPVMPFPTPTPYWFPGDRQLYPWMVKLQPDMSFCNCGSPSSKVHNCQPVNCLYLIKFSCQNNPSKGDFWTVKQATLCLILCKL